VAAVSRWPCMTHGRFDADELALDQKSDRLGGIEYWTDASLEEDAVRAHVDNGRRLGELEDTPEGANDVVAIVGAAISGGSHGSNRQALPGISAST